ncbi:MAG: tRNA 4-thiouridine(8) synthase ThiI, partial [Candidatus Magasanikbacteria bacterium]|nr:tRNA 4-thiouridine(8) synthase ThiI [Candidatus Magasanikbacteria bacterium]
MPTKNTKAIVLLSGGLDSMLAVKVLQVQGIEVVGLCYKSNFYDCARAREAAELLRIELKEVDISSEMLDLVKHPPSGYGKNLNPCIDCHAFMIRRAGEIARAEGFDFVATGEVLGQRPFSQNKESLKRVAALSGVPVLRPLSAKLIDETEIEKNGLVNRHRLLDISGRGRERQIELAEKYEITEYPSPAGGCLLTDPGFSERGIKLLDHWPDCDTNDIEILKHGRVFWFSLPRKKKVLLMIGRHQGDNE